MFTLEAVDVLGEAIVVVIVEVMERCRGGRGGRWPVVHVVDIGACLVALDSPIQ